MFSFSGRYGRAVDVLKVFNVENSINFQRPALRRTTFLIRYRLPFHNPIRTY